MRKGLRKNIERVIMNSDFIFVSFYLLQSNNNTIIASVEKKIIKQYTIIWY